MGAWSSYVVELAAARAEAVHHQLVRLLESPAFRNSKRSQNADRVAALEIRNRLDRCVAEAGPGDEVQVVLRLGSYVAVFRFGEAPVAQAETPEGRRRAKLLIATVAIALAIVSVCVWLPWRSSTKTRLLSEFWRPVLVNPTAESSVFSLCLRILETSQRELFFPLPAGSWKLARRPAPGHRHANLRFRTEVGFDYCHH